LNDKIVPSPASEPSELTSEERAQRLKAEVERLANFFKAEYTLYAQDEGHAAKYGIDSAKLLKLVEARVKEKQAAKKAEDTAQRRAETKAERDRKEQKQRDTAGAKAAAKAAAQVEKAAREEAEKIARRENEKRTAFAAIIELPRAMHEARLADLAKQLGEDVAAIEEEFVAYAKVFETRGMKDVARWAEPVTAKELLEGFVSQQRRYLVMQDHEHLGMALSMIFAWVHQHATHSPVLTFRSPAPGTGKSEACYAVKLLTPRGATFAEITATTLYRYVDHVCPTLIVDDADKLFKRRPELAHLVNVSWMLGTYIPRMVGKVMVEFDPYCPKVIAGKNLTLPDTTESRTINIKMRRKLATEEVEFFSHEDDEAFYTLRQKAARFAADHGKALGKAKPTLPPGFDNRLAANWRIMLAIGDMAGGEYPAWSRTAAIKLSAQPELGEEIRLLAAVREMFMSTARPWLSSEEIVEKVMKTFLIGTALCFMAMPANACWPPKAGDQYSRANQIFEVVKVNSRTCYFTLCVRPLGSTQSCHWLKRDETDQISKWLVLDGVNQEEN
jgi:hypothetical protein